MGVADALQDWCGNAAALLADELPKLSCGGFAVNHRKHVNIDIYDVGVCLRCVPSRHKTAWPGTPLPGTSEVRDSRNVTQIGGITIWCNTMLLVTNVAAVFCNWCMWQLHTFLSCNVGFLSQLWFVAGKPDQQVLSSVYPWKWQPSQRWISTEGAVTRRTQASVGASNDQVTLGIRPHRRCQGVFCWHAFGSNCNNYSALAWTIFALESSVLPSFYRDLKSAKLPNLGPTWAQHGPSIPQHRPNMDPKSSNMPQHRPNMGPSMCPTLPNIEPTWAQHTPNMHPTKAKHRT